MIITAKHTNNSIVTFFLSPEKARSLSYGSQCFKKRFKQAYNMTIMSITHYI